MCSFDMEAIDPKAARVRCPVCYHPEPLLATICVTCGARLDPRRQYETLTTEKTETYT